MSGPVAWRLALGRRAWLGTLAAVAASALLAPAGTLAQARTQAARTADVYWPGPRDDWEKRTPEQVGMDGAKVQEAIAWLTAPERNGAPEDLERHLAVDFWAKEPYAGKLGPIKSHGPPSGVILRHGYIVAEWGDPQRIDMTFSVTKSFVSTTWGLAYDRGLIKNVNDRVIDYVKDGTFDSPRNSKITWDMLLRKTSEWEGSLFGIPTWSDRFNGTIRELQEPGTHYEYNDVRVNVLALALLHVWRRPLPQVLREYVMDPIGATGWQWHGYDNAWVTIDGQKMQSVTGGGHWGGGMFISARDQARFGLLHMRGGRWKDKQILSEGYLKLATTPGTLNGGGFGNYGMPGLRAQGGGRGGRGGGGREGGPPAPPPANPPSERAITHSGNGPNRIFSDPRYDLVIVTRWSNGGEFIQRIIDAIDPKTVTASYQN
jgi:CubicO group peptidase (beta-lactamase class C family)